MKLQMVQNSDYNDYLYEVLTPIKAKQIIVQYLREDDI